jgi:hypothetical protein
VRASDAFGALFTFQTAHLRSRGAFFAPGVLQLCFANPNRGVGGAPRDVRVRARHPWGTPSCVKDARERAYDAAYQALARRLASHDAGRSPLGAPPWRFWAPGAALPSPWAPAVLQRRAVALRIRAASSSHPGRSAWRAGSRASRGERLRAAAAGRHSPLRLQDRLRRRPSMSEDGNVLTRPRYVVKKNIRLVAKKERPPLSPCRPQLNGYSSPPALSETMKHYGRTPIRRALDRNQARRS